MKSSYIFIADGFEEIEATTIIDILRRAGINCVTVSVNNINEATGSHGIKIICDEVFTSGNYSDADMLILPGGGVGTENLKKHQELGELIVKFDREKKLLGAICAAPSVFGSLGLLKGKDVTCYPGAVDDSVGANILTDNVVVCENIITSRGASTASEFAFKIVETLADKNIVENVARDMLFI